ncbi:UNVERIFIED_CONTAM: putative 3-deoxy-D-manno-octulosonic acid transferase, mitochondrial [Sesamum calycinum]|uniref:3-deoxy-D-manno-octulosonic acid transferase, mitochondrial n=1 Tax=Sesamum calycinum TaxID=2727403 RepID=A0AAW2NWF8_9LAMI
MASKRGEAVYRIYRALTYGVSPLVRLHLRWRKFRGREHSLRWRERLGCPSAPRPTGRLIWFHAVSLGEGLAAIPVIRCCLEMRPDVNVLMTTTTASAFEVIKNRLPIFPLDIPSAVDSFLRYWRPNAVMLMESEIWPNLIMGAARNGIIPELVSSSNSSIDHIDAIKVFIDSPFAIANFDISEGDTKTLEQFWAQLSHRKVWMASSIHKGEEKVFLEAHNMLKQKHADILTIIVPRKPQHGQDLALKLQDEGATVALRSRGELRDFYRLTPIAVIGGSFLKGSAGHNIAEAAAAGCAVLTGHHVGHFSHMVAEMQRVNPLSVLLVSGERLVEVVNQLFDNFKILEAHRVAAKQAYLALSSGIVKKLWEMLHFHVFMKSISRADDDVEKLNTTEKL